MPMKLLRRYATASVIDFSLFDPTGVNLITTAIHATGDTKISIDGGSESNTINGFILVDQGYRLTLDAAELTGKSMRIPIVDQTDPKVWLDDFIIIETYGDQNAMHQFVDSNTIIDGVTVESINEFLMAMANGRFLKDTPSSGDITFYKRDNVTPLFVVHVDEDSGERTRITPA